MLHCCDVLLVPLSRKDILSIGHEVDKYKKKEEGNAEFSSHVVVAVREGAKFAEFPKGRAHP